MLAGYRTKVAAGIAIAIALAAVLGSYLVLNYPAQATGTGGGGPGILSVHSNEFVVVGPFPHLGEPFAIWHANLGNSGGTALYATYQLMANGVIVDGNSTVIPPGESRNTSSCQAPTLPAASFDFSVFITNQTGTVVPHFPLTVRNVTHVPFSGQFSVSASVYGPRYDKEANQTLPSWGVAITNTGNRPIEYLYVELSNETGAITLGRLRCAGADNYPGTPDGYAQPLAQGQVDDYQQWLFSPAGSAVAAGRTYTVTVLAVYSDFTEVVQTYSVQATA